MPPSLDRVSNNVPKGTERSPPPLLHATLILNIKSPGHQETILTLGGEMDCSNGVECVSKHLVREYRGMGPNEYSRVGS